MAKFHGFHAMAIGAIGAAGRIHQEALGSHARGARTWTVAFCHGDISSDCGDGGDGHVNGIVMGYLYYIYGIFMDIHTF